MKIGKVILIGAIGIPVALAFVGSIESQTGAAAPIAAVAPVAEECNVDKIDLRHLVYEKGRYSDRVKGEIINGCDKAVGVQLMVTARYKDGDIAWSTSFWPASTTNISKGDSFPFDYPVDQVRKPVDVTTRVQRVRTW